MKTEQNDEKRETDKKESATHLKKGKGRVPKNQNDEKRESSIPYHISYFPDLESLVKQQEEIMKKILNPAGEGIKERMLKVGEAIIKEDIKLLKELAKH